MKSNKKNIGQSSSDDTLFYVEFEFIEELV